jgi:hypothetical protein
MIDLTRAALVAFALSTLSAPAQEQIPSSNTIIAQSPRPYHCYELPYDECVKCALARGFSRAEARSYCRMRR